jgi:Xaa-Pro aminopeptidase
MLPNAPSYTHRLNALRSQLAETQSSGILVTSFTNVAYLTGFLGGDSYLFVASDASILISDGRYTQDIANDCPQQETLIRPPHQSLIAAAGSVIEKSGESVIRLESNSLLVAEYNQLREECTSCEFELGTSDVERLRLIKDDYELQRIQSAIGIAESSFATLMTELSVSTTEKRAADRLDAIIRELGGKGTAFSPIVGAGPRSALPHGVPSDLVLSTAEFTLIDWGANEGQYLSDLTRIVPTAPISKRLSETYAAVLAAHDAAAAKLAPGVPLCDIDSAARQILAEAGLVEHFTHGLGHGFGLEIHESPRMSQNQTDLLLPGMVVTVEPGVYFGDWGGIRIEDDYLITTEGSRQLTTMSRRLEDFCIELS